MRILPVIDLLGGVVVRGVAGRRDEYRPVESCLTSSAVPLQVACAFRERLGLQELYVADLDAIQGAPPNLDALEQLVGSGFGLWIDAGLRDDTQAQPLLDAGVRRLIAGLETLPGPDFLHQLCCASGSEQIVFSLDLLEGRPLAATGAWPTDDPLQIARLALEAGVRTMIVLDLAAVGVSGGLSTIALCRRLRSESPELQLLTGGGVRSVDDLRMLKNEGIDGVLLASALHNGTLGRPQIEAFSGTVDRRPPRM